MEEADSRVEALAAIVETSSDFVGIADPDGRVLFVNRAGREMLGLSVERSLDELTIGDFHSPEAAALVKEHGLPAALALRVATIENTMRRFDDGQDVPVSQLIIAHRGDRGQVSCFSTVARDISSQKSAEEALRGSEERFRLLIDDLHVGVLVQDAEARIVLSNSKALELLGLTLDQLLGKSSLDPAWNVIHEDGTDFPGSTHPVPTAIKTGKPVRNVIMGVWRPSRGDRVWLLVNAEPQLTGGAVERVVCTFSDVTDRKQLEETLLQSQKMEAVGRLAGGVAHDFNNLLTVIIGYVEDVASSLPANAREREELSIALGAAQRAAGLTRQLLAFARRELIVPQVVDLNAVMDATERMLGRLIGEHIELSCRRAPGLWSVRVDPHQIEQVIVNLAVNARDAMPEGGKLTIETANVTLGDDYASTHASVNAGDYVLLAVNDSGHGIDRDTLPHVFEPFFTTKEASRGTGLGLATVHGIVRQHGGHIWVYSELGRGTSFKIYLPRNVTSEPLEIAPKPVPIPRSGNEVVLLAEDEELVRSFARRVLERGGYRVIPAANPLQALRLAAEFEGEIHLLVTDVVMPHMSGRKLAQELRAVRSGMRVLFVSGYTENYVVQHGVLDEGVAFLPKPYSPVELLARVRRVLEGE